MKERLLTLFPVLIFFLVWEVSARLLRFELKDLFPPVSSVVYEVIRLTFIGLMREHILMSLMRVMIGFTIGAFLGILVGTLLGLKNLIDRSLSPIVSILYPIPALGWVPLLMVWVGINELLPISIIAIHSFFPVCYTVRSGIKNIDQKVVKVARTFGARGLTLFRKVIFPLAFPSFISGLRLSSGGAFRVVIASEMIAMPKGLGALLMRAESLVRVDIILACLFLLTIMSLLFERIFVHLERRYSF